MRSFSITFADNLVHNLKTLLQVTYTSPDEIFEFQECTFLADDTNGASNVYLGGSDLDVATLKFSEKLTASASSLHRNAGLGQRVWLSEIYVQANAGTPTLHINGIR